MRLGRSLIRLAIPKEDLPNEINSFAFALTGLVNEKKDFQTKPVAVDFFYAKGVVEALFAKLGLTAEYVASNQIKSLHPGRSALISINGQPVGFVGQVHPTTSKAYDIPANLCGWAQSVCYRRAAPASTAIYRNH